MPFLTIFQIYRARFKPSTVKPVLRGHIWDKEKVALLDMWSLKRGLIHIKFL